MTSEQQIQWIALPHGTAADGTRPQVSVFVAPRLRSDEGNLLMLFPDFLDWPARLATASFLFGSTDSSGNPLEPFLEPDDMTGPPPDSALWRRFFRPETPVEPFVPDDYTGRPIVTYPAHEVARSTQMGFARTAAAFPDEMPEPQAMANVSGLAGLAMEQGIAAMEDHIAQALAIFSQDAADRPMEFVQPEELSAQERLMAFHQAARGLATLAPEDEPPPLVQEEMDFHRMLSVLGNHPFLLRRLGLVLDFVLPADLLASDEDLCLMVAPTWTSLLPEGASQDRTPCTAYTFSADAGVFTASARGDPLGPPARGLVALPESEFSIEQADIDGAALKLVAAGATAGIAPSDGAPVQQAPPAVRTEGLALAREGRAGFLHQDFVEATQREESLTQDESVILTAEDLIRGHRLDIWDEDRQRWYSLHERVVEYSGPEGTSDPIASVTDEGFFEVSLTTPPGRTDLLRVHEHVITWDGWGLSATMPGKIMTNDAEPQRMPNTATTMLPLRIETVTRPGSLPRLRFGHAYRVRVRTVDLAGNGPTPAEAEALLDSDLLVLPGHGRLVFRRFEPVPAPTLVPRSPLQEAESAHRLVVRSSAEMTPAQFAADFATTPLVTSGAHPPYGPFDERHIVAPRTTLQCVERHGMLDDAIASPDPAVRRAVYETATRESATLDDPSLPGLQLVEIPQAAGATTVHHYAVHTAEQVAVPYLPDPLSTGVVFHGLPGMTDGEPFEVSWEGDTWHTPASLRLRVVEGTGPPRWEASKRVLTVALPKASVATVRVCSRAEADENIMGMLHWCRESLAADQPDQLDKVLEAAAGNRHWMLTPWYEITLVHAVQRPLDVPSLTLFDSPVRDPGATAEHLVGAVDLHAGSTERIDLIAEWTESVDDLQEDEPRPRRMSCPLFQLPLAFAAQFPNDAPSEEVPCRLDGNTLTFDTLVAEATGQPYPAKHDFGDTKHRVVGYHPVATTAFGEYFPSEFAQEPERELLSRRGEPMEHHILNSAPPAAPGVLSCLPTIAFDDLSDEPGVTIRRRRGGGLRVHLSRPWFSSGDGELLGVVVNEEQDGPPTAAHPFVTLMGRDPVFRSAAVTHPTAEAFPGASHIAEHIVMPRVFDGFTVTVAGYEPQYDRETKQWFCDIDIDTGDAYFPFVRLALARFQPSSLEGTHLSPVVLTDLVRTLPERVLTITGTDTRTLSVTGPSYDPTATVPGHMLCCLERRDPAIPDDALAWSEIHQSEIPLTRDDTESPARVTYTGEFQVPPAPPGERRRVLVFETEGIQADQGFPGATEARVVYCDTLEL
ncbi:hypothetical protein [Streptomyces flavidovirens]